MKKLMCMLLVICLICSMIPASFAAGHPFTDVPDGTYYSEPVAFCYTNGLMNGTSPTQFQPDLEMSRAMLVTVLYRMDGSHKAEGQTPFGDVASGSYYEDAVTWAFAKEVVKGLTPTSFGPNSTISREQMVTIFFRYARTKELDVSASADLTGYQDNKKISYYAEAAFAWAVAEGIINGTSPTLLSPAGTATRAQCATIIQRFMKWTQKNEEETTEPSTEPTEKPTDPTPPATEPTQPATEPSTPATDPTENTTPATDPTETTEPVTDPSTPSTDPTENTEPATDPSEPTTPPSDPTAPTEHTHSFGEWETLEPTCTKWGYDYRFCECGVSQYANDTPPTGHTWGEWVTIQNPTTTQIGLKERTCSVCQTVESAESPTHKHSYGEVQIVDSTCTEEGYKYQVCDCGYEYRGAVIPVKDHDYEVLSSEAATCTEDGSKTYKCKNCDTGYTEDVSAFGHTWEYEHTDEVGHWGDYLLVCRCGWSCSESAAIELGYRDEISYWSNAHMDYYRTPGSVNDHSYTYKNPEDFWVVDTPAVDKWTCSECGVATEDHDEVTGHSMRRTSKGYPTCMEGSYDHYICRVCSYTYKDNYQEALGHSWGDWVIQEEPSETSRGWAVRTCTWKYPFVDVYCEYEMGDYADVIDEHYHSYKPDYQTVCIECGEDSAPQ